jgi:beta-lactam-binding protein with PASTA domain
VLSKPSAATPGPEVIPNVVGMQRATAEKQLEDLGVLFLVNPVGGKDDDRVMSQNPAAGTPVGKAKHVLLSVRCRPKPCPMPPEGRQMYDPCACLWR